MLPAQVAQPLNMIWPIILVFLSVPILKQKRNQKFYCPIYQFTGVYIISSQVSLFERTCRSNRGATGDRKFSLLGFLFHPQCKDKKEKSVNCSRTLRFGSVYLVVATIIIGEMAYRNEFQGSSCVNLCWYI